MEEIMDRVEYDGQHGFVELVDVFGSDDRIANVARGSYKKGTKQVSSNEQLLRYLVRHEHSSPIEFSSVLFHIRIPIFVARQLHRHRTIKCNEQSLRYSEAEELFYLPDAKQLGPQSTKNKQGRSEPSSSVDTINAQLSKYDYQESQQDSFKSYQKLLDKNISREIARGVLPVSLYTEMSVSWDLRNFLGFLKLRLHPHAQYEIRIMAQVMYNLAKPHFPITCQAWEDYVLNSHSLSSLDQKLLATITNIQTDTPSEELALSLGMSKREYVDFCTWLNTLKLIKGT